MIYFRLVIFTLMTLCTGMLLGAYLATADIVNLLATFIGIFAMAVNLHYLLIEIEEVKNGR